MWYWKVSAVAAMSFAFGAWAAEPIPRSELIGELEYGAGIAAELKGCSYLERAPEGKDTHRAYELEREMLRLARTAGNLNADYAEIQLGKVWMHTRAQGGGLLGLEATSPKLAEEKCATARRLSDLFLARSKATQYRSSK